METITETPNLETTENTWDIERSSEELRNRVLSRLALLDSVEL